jgi:hypothetical protein
MDTDYADDVADKLYTILEPIWNILWKDGNLPKLDAHTLATVELKLISLFEEEWQKAYKAGFIAAVTDGVT